MRVAAISMMRTALRLVELEDRLLRSKSLLMWAIIIIITAVAVLAALSAVRAGRNVKKSIYTATITLAATTITITTITKPAVTAVTAEEGRQSPPTFPRCRLPLCHRTFTSSRRQ